MALPATKHRKDLQVLLEKTLGSKQVYYRTPSNTKMIYPAIVYRLEGVARKDADNGLYLVHNRYEITLIEREADSKYIMSILALPYCKHVSHFVADGLEHNTFTIFW